MTALWIHEVADRFWADVGDAPAGFPRELVEVVCWALPVDPVELGDLTVAGVNAWLAQRRIEIRLTIPNRRLRACILVHEGNGVLFVDATDPDDERRFSVAHEIAHFLIEYATPRRQARAHLGNVILPVLDGLRAASWDERLGAILGGVSLDASVHLMERTPDGYLPGREVSVAEQRADELAFELLAPYDVVRARLTDRASREDAESLLRTTFGLPSLPASTYARALVPDLPAGSLFRRLFSVS